MSMDRAQRTRRMVLGTGAAYLLLAWLSSRAGEYLAAIQLLYVLPMAYGMLRLDRFRVACLTSFALITHGTALFMLVDSDHQLNQPAIWAQFAALALGFAWCGYAAGGVLRLRDRLAEARRSLHDIGLEASDRASRDALTGAYHHHHLMEVLEREIARAERVGKPLSIARVDLDGLGSVNETHGDAVGDIALKRFADACADALRNVDIMGRYSGKEFIALMPDTDLKGALIAAERLRVAVGREPLPEVKGRRHLSCTLGVAEHRKGENTRLLIGRAESALNYAKAAGRDRVVALDADGKPMLIGTA
jgi:diguanylate cyclase (GGDEF)-like protein